MSDKHRPLFIHEDGSVELKDEPKAAESESFSLSKPKQIEDVMDDIANEKPASSSEFDAGGAEKFVDLEFGDQQGLSYENVVTAMRWQHARDAEEIRGFRDEKDDAWDAYKHLLGSAKDKTNQLYFAQEKIQKLTEENQRLRSCFLDTEESNADMYSKCKKAEERIEKLEKEIVRLDRVILKELTENDELGCEYTYVNVLRESNRKLTAAIQQRLDFEDGIIHKNVSLREALAADEKEG